MRPTIIFLLLCGTMARAEVFNGAISKALAGGGRAGLPGMESVFLNPALVPLVRASELSAYYNDGYVGRGAHRNAYGVGVVDAEKDVYFPGALHYIRTRDTGRAAGAVDGELWHLGFGKNVSEILAVGISAYRIEYEVKDDRSYTQWNGSIGALFLLRENLGLAYVLDNVAKPGSETPAGLREDMKQGIGLFGSVAAMVRLRGDVWRVEKHNPKQKLGYAFSVESMTSQWLLFRVGYRREELADARFYTAGFGFNGPRLRVDYAFEKNAKGTGGAVHSVDLSVPF